MKYLVLTFLILSLVTLSGLGLRTVKNKLTARRFFNVGMKEFEAARRALKN